MIAYHVYLKMVAYQNATPDWTFLLQAGINLGEARGFQPLPYSGREEVQNLDTQGGSNVTGRYMYRVSGEKPFRGGCTNDTTLSQYTQAVTLIEFEMFGRDW